MACLEKPRTVMGPAVTTSCRCFLTLSRPSKSFRFTACSATTAKWAWVGRITRNMVGRWFAAER